MDSRQRIKLYWIAGIVSAFVGLLFHLNIIPAVHSLATRPSKEEIWSYVQKQSAVHNLDPHFVYAIIFAESSFNPDADVGYARGLMQMSEAAWETVETSSWRKAFNWKDNINAGTAYLAYLRGRLTQAGHFNYPLLAASYRFGFGAVQQANFQIKKVRKPQNSTYKALFAGNTSPVPPPTATS